MRRPSPVLALLALVLLPALGGAAGLPDRDAEREHEPERITLDEMLVRAAGAGPGAAVGARFESALLPAVGPLMPWTALGPRPLTNEYWSSDRPASGRTNAVAVDPRNTDRVYIAAAQGGVWRSETGGLSWTALTDALPSLASGDVALEPGNPDVVWYGTGEQNFSADSYYGDGLFRSPDRGATWVKLADRAQVGSYIARVVPGIGSADTLLVASESGVRRSTNGGVTWTQRIAGTATDLLVDPTNRLHLLAAVSGAGVYRSLDGGNVWTLQTGGIGLPAFARVNLGLSGDGLRVYASFVSSGGGLAAFARSNDGGATWTLLAGVPNYLLTQGWYDNAVAVHPMNADVVVAGGVYPYSGGTGGVIRSTDGGATWSNVTIGGDGLGVHPDQHRLVFDANGRLWLANDGGVFMSDDVGNTWKARNDGLETLQFYTVGLHPTNPNRMTGGTQDNGTAWYEGLPEWPELVAGDGGPVGFEWASPNTHYSTYVRLNPLYKWNDFGYAGDVTGGWTAQAADWANGAFTIDPNVPATLLVGTTRVWRSTNSGGSWTQISPALSGSVLKAVSVARGAPGTMWTSSSTGGVWRTKDDGVTWPAMNVGLPTGSAVNDLAIRPGAPDDVILGVDRSALDRVFRFNADSARWFPYGSGLPSGLRVQSLAVDWRGTRPHVFAGTDRGVYALLDSTWFLAGTGLPAVAVYDLAVDTTNNRLVAATHGRSMWSATIDGTAPAVTVLAPNGGELLGVGSVANLQWNATDVSGVSAVDLVLEDQANALSRVVATGVPNTGSLGWTVVPPLSSAVRLRVRATDAWGNAREDLSDAPFGITAGVGVGEGPLAGARGITRVGPNPARGEVGIEWSLPEAGPAVLRVLDLQGREVATLARGTFAAGRHDARWDGRAAGAGAAPGVYFVQLAAGGRTDVRRVMLAR